MSSVDLPARPSYRAVLDNGPFRSLWLSQLVSGLGDALAMVAMPLLVYRMTGSAGLLGLIFVLQLVPRVLLAPLAGVLADRLDRRRLMIAGDLGRAVAVGVLPLTSHVWQVAVLAIVVAIGNAVVRPAELAAVPMVVAPGALVAALSLTQVTSGVTRVVGPALGAGVVGAVGPAPAFWLQTCAFLASAAFLSRLSLPKKRTTVPDDATVSMLAAVRREMWEGAHVVWRNRIVRGIAAVEALWQLVGAVLVVDAVVYAERVLKLGDRAGSTFALLMATVSGGATVGALIADRVERRLGRRRLMAVGYLGPLALIPAGLVPPLWVLFVCWFALGFTDAWAVIAMQAYLAEAVPNQLRGRVYAMWGAVVTLAGAGWFALAGWLTPRIGAPAMLATAGMLVGAGGPMLLLVSGALRAMGSHVPVGSTSELDATSV